MNKLFASLKKHFPLFLFLFASFSIAGATLVIAQTVSDDHSLDVTAQVGSLTPPGGGGSGSSNATVSMSGLSYPNSKLTLLKDGQVFTTLFAGQNGSFQITVNNLTFGNYQFSIFAEDVNGLTSSPHVINVSAFSSQPYQYTGIVMPPTIAVDPSTVQVGQNFAVHGYSVPNSLVVLELPNVTNLGQTTSDSNGFYQITARAAFTAGTYFLRTKSTFAGISSFYSRPVALVVYVPGQTVPPSPELGLCVDYNKDGRVNLIDFSILLYWFDAPTPPARIDCNRDNRIDIRDFSVLMYFWTG